MARLAAVSAFVADRVGQHYDDVMHRAFARASGAVQGVEVSTARGAAR
jgi:hypothetical protein